MQKDLLKLLDLSKEDILNILNTADQLKYNQKHGIVHDYLHGKTLAMIFEKNSTRTRVSFETGMFQLGGHALFLSGKESQIGRGEPVEDTARVLDRYCDGIMIRTFAQEEVEELARFTTIPIINGLTDFCHPCQVLADLMTVREHKAVLEGLKMCYIGDGNNMANSLIVGGLKCGMEVAVACPEGYEPDEQVLDFARSDPSFRFSLHRAPKDAAVDADVIFTDVWASMGQEEERAIRAKAFEGYQINQELMDLAHPDCMVQHCLPAHRGEEITADVFEAHAQEIFDEAENRLHAQKAVMYLLMKNKEDYPPIVAPVIARRATPDVAIRFSVPKTTNTPWQPTSRQGVFMLLLVLTSPSAPQTAGASRPFRHGWRQLWEPGCCCPGQTGCQHSRPRPWTDWPRRRCCRSR